MATQRFLANIGGAIREVVATITSAGAADAGKIPALDSAGKLDLTMMPSALGPDAQAIQASEDIGAGKLVNIHDVAGAFRIRLADASNNRPAHGFVKVAVLNTAMGTVYFDSSDDVLSGLSPGEQFLSESVPGGVTETAPTTPGSIVQKVGFAYSATAMNFQYTPPILLA